MKRELEYLRARLAVWIYHMTLLAVPFEKKLDLIKMSDDRIIRPFIESRDRYQMDIVARVMAVNANEFSKYSKKLIKKLIK